MKESVIVSEGDCCRAKSTACGLIPWSSALIYRAAPTRRLRRHRSPSEHVDVRRCEGGRRAAVAGLRVTPRTVDDVEGVCTTRSAAREHLIDILLVVGQGSMLAAASVDMFPARIIGQRIELVQMFSERFLVRFRSWMSSLTTVRADLYEPRRRFEHCLNDAEWRARAARSQPQRSPIDARLLRPKA